MPNKAIYRAQKANGMTLQWLKKTDVNFLKREKRDPREANNVVLSRLLREVRALRKGKRR